MSNNTDKLLKHVEQKRPESTYCRIIFIGSSKTDKAKLGEWNSSSDREGQVGRKGHKRTCLKYVPVLHINYTSKHMK